MPSSDQRLSAGDADFGDAQLRPGPDDGQELFVAQNIGMGQPGHAFFRHAVNAAQITAVGYRDPQIINRALK